MSNSPHKLIYSLWAWSAHWLAWSNSLFRDSSGWWVSYEANSDFWCSHSLLSRWASASDRLLRASPSPWMAISASHSRKSRKLGLLTDFWTRSTCVHMFLSTLATDLSLRTGRPALLNDLSQGTGFPELQNDSIIDSYPCNGLPVLGNQSKFINADTILATEHLLPTACWRTSSKSSNTANFKSSSMSKFSRRAAMLIGVYSLLTSMEVLESVCLGS